MEAGEGERRGKEGDKAHIATMDEKTFRNGAPSFILVFKSRSRQGWGSKPGLGAERPATAAY